MQDKITIADAPDCLNTNDKAMWVLGYQAALAARSTVLHQIRVPSATEQAAWHAGLDEGRAQAAGSVSNATSQAAPAAVAVPDARAAFENFIQSPIPRDFYARVYENWDVNNKWLGWQACAALAATPAAAPVVLPDQHTDDDKTTREEYRRMFIAACGDLGLINEALDLDPDDGGAEPILAAIEELKSNKSLVLPEPEAVIREVMELVKDWAQRDLIAVEAGIDTLTEESSEKEHQEAKRLDGEAETAYRAIEAKLRALLAQAATAAAPQAQDAVTVPVSVLSDLRKDHIYMGLCPEDSQPDSRDDECPCCKAIVTIDTAIAAAKGE